MKPIVPPKTKITLTPGQGAAARNKALKQEANQAAKKKADAAKAAEAKKNNPPVQAPPPTPPPLTPPPTSTPPAMVPPPAMRPPSLVSAPAVTSAPAYKATELAPPPAPVTAIPPVQVLGETTQNAAMDAKRRQQGQGFNYSKTLMRKGRGAQ